LLRGEIERVIAAVRDLCRGRHSKALRTQRDYSHQEPESHGLWQAHGAEAADWQRHD
jgi:hypothetical protein